MEGLPFGAAAKMTSVELSDNSMAGSEEVSMGGESSGAMSKEVVESLRVPRLATLLETAEEDGEDELDAQPPEEISAELGLSLWISDLGQFPYPLLLPEAKVVRLGCISCKIV